MNLQHSVTATFQNYTDLENGLAALRYNGWQVRNIRNKVLVAVSTEHDEPAYVAQRLISSGARSIVIREINVRNHSRLANAA